MMRAAIYCRVSSEEQVEGHSLAYQLEDCRRAAEAAGYEVVAEYADEGISGRSIDKRVDFQRVIADAKGGQWDALFVWKWERLARNREDSIVFKNLLRKRGIKVLAAKDPGGTDNPADALIEGVLESVAEWYSVDLKQKVARARQRRADLGLYNGHLPYGYDPDPASVKGNPLPPVINTEEAAIVLMAFELYSTGCVTMTTVAVAMNDRSALTRNKHKRAKYALTGPRPWTKGSVRDMLGNPFYQGVVSYHGSLRPGRHEAIIDPALWEKVAAVRNDHYRGAPKLSKLNRLYQLKGLARCVNCGEKLWTNTNHAGSYYRDPSSIRGLDCIGGSVRVDVVDTQVDAIMQRFSLPGSWREEVLARYGEGSDLERVERERHRLEEKRKRLVRLYVDDLMTESEYAREKLEIEAALSLLQIPGQTAVLNAAEFLENAGNLWARMAVGEKWEALGIMVEAVYLNLQTKRVVGIRPKPEFRQVFSMFADRLCMASLEGFKDAVSTHLLMRFAPYELRRAAGRGQTL